MTSAASPSKDASTSQTSRRPLPSVAVLRAGERLLHDWLRLPFLLAVRHKRKAKSGAPTFVFIHGIGNSADSWVDIIPEVPKNAGILSVDLLGFGRSSKPTWATYDARVQARALIRTIKRMSIKKPVVLVGHSLGALVSVEAAKIRPTRFRELILCSPPFYEERGTTLRERATGDHLRRQLYSLMERHPDQLIKISALANRVGLFSATFELTADNVHSYIGSLKAAIINQTSLADARTLELPITILYGRLDPLIIPRHIRRLGTSKENVTARPLAAGHEVRGRMRQALLGLLHAEHKTESKTPRKP